MAWLIRGPSDLGPRVQRVSACTLPSRASCCHFGGWDGQVMRHILGHGFAFKFVSVMNDHVELPRPDFRSRAGARLLRLVNPLTRRLIAVGLPTGAPNVVLTMRGRRSGKLRSIPVGLLELEGRWYVQASYGETGWVANLRADSEATVVHPGGRSVPVRAVELSPEQGAAVLHHALSRFRRSRVLRAVVGPTFRPPVGVLLTLRLRVDDTVEEWSDDARRHPLFELRSRAEADA